MLAPPEWVDAFIDLLGRFSKWSGLATNILRWLDLWGAELVGAHGSLRAASHLFGGQERELQAATDLLTAFLSRVWGVSGLQASAASNGTQLGLSEAPPDSDAEKETVDAAAVTDTNNAPQVEKTVVTESDQDVGEDELDQEDPKNKGKFAF